MADDLPIRHPSTIPGALTTKNVKNYVQQPLGDIKTQDAWGDEILIREEPAGPRIYGHGRACYQHPYDGPVIRVRLVYDIHGLAIGTSLARLLKPMIDKLAAMDDADG